MPYQIRITTADCETLSGQTGLKGMISGLRAMKAWAEEHTPGWTYIAGLQRFQFQTADDLDRFEATFKSAPEA
ncbi:hypothetical protein PAPPERLAPAPP_02720 [Brevundimonas phage vB_BpoS-Papperlapapp]|nr:hypothetical protein PAPPERLAPAPP_02720 [Brevundimonas phage vB_BpoS-Papperlapapp]